MFDKMRNTNLEVSAKTKIRLEVDQNGAFNYEGAGEKMGAK